MYSSTHTHVHTHPLIMIVMYRSLCLWLATNLFSYFNISKVLEEFTQADSSTSREYGGTGLGLSIVNKLLNLFDSQLDVSSTLGKGSIFSFELNVNVVELLVKDTIKELSVVAFKSQKILVAEDNKTNQMLIKLILEDMNLDVTIAEDGVIVCEMFEDGEYDLILMDINMPNRNGEDSMRYIKAYEQENSLEATSVIALTANAVSGDKARYLEMGFDDYLSKPIDSTVLVQILKENLH